MEKFSEIFSNFFKTMSSYWYSLTFNKKIGFSSFAFLVLVSIGSVFFLYEDTSYKYLFVDLSPEDTGAISDFLKKNNQNDFIVDAKGIKVPQEKLDNLRVLLSQEGLPNKGTVGWEKFDKDDFTRTEFEQQIHKLRAIQGELARTISSIKGINSARVHIVTPQKSLFSDDNKKAPTAAIYLKTNRGSELDKKQIKGIQHLVAKSVEGLEINNISIIDGEGKLLTDSEPTESSAKQSRELTNYKNNMEKVFEERIRGIVGKIVGQERVEAKVDAEVDFTEETQTISDVDPDNVVVVSKNTTGFSMEGQGLNPTGIPGSKSNVPGEQEQTNAGATSKAGSKKDTEVINYEFSKKVSHKTIAVGKVLRLTISAIVDGSQVYPLDGSVPEFVPRPPEEIKKIEELIKNSVGFKEGRDSLTVQNLMFQLDPFQVSEISKKRKEEREHLSTLAISGLVALALMLFFAFIVRPYFRWLSFDPEKKEEQSIIEEYKPNLEVGAMQKVHIQEDVPFEKLSPKEQVLFLAKNEPKRTTEAIRVMLSPSHAQ